jgi:hypothetical protein
MRHDQCPLYHSLMFSPPFTNMKWYWFNHCGALQCAAQGLAHSKNVKHQEGKGEGHWEKESAYLQAPWKLSPKDYEGGDSLSLVRSTELSSSSRTHKHTCSLRPLPTGTQHLGHIKCLVSEQWFSLEPTCQLPVRLSPNLPLSNPSSSGEVPLLEQLWQRQHQRPPRWTAWPFFPPILQINW